MTRCLTPGCPVDRGTRSHPGCAGRLLSRALFLVLVAVLLVSLGIGFRSLNETGHSTPISESAPLTGPEAIDLVSQAQNHA